MTPDAPARLAAQGRDRASGRGAGVEWSIPTTFTFVACAALAVAAILAMTTALSFHGDEWSYIVDRRLTFESLLAPHNEHLAALHVLVYRGLVELVGTGSYLPFLAVLMVLHVAFAAGIRALLRPAAGDLGALLAGVLVLFLGNGADNLMWAFQIGFVGSLAAGVWAMVLADRPKIAAALLGVSIATQSTGLFFVAPLAVLVRDRRWLVLPVVLYACWYAANRVPVVPASPEAYVAYALTLTGNVFAGLSGIPLGLVLAAAVLPFVGRSRWALAGLAGFASQVVILTVGRAHFGPDQAMASRYVYAAAPFVLLMLTSVRLPRPVWGVAFAFALAVNFMAIPHGVSLYRGFLAYDRSIPLEQRLAPFR